MTSVKLCGLVVQFANFERVSKLHIPNEKVLNITGAWLFL